MFVQYLRKKFPVLLLESKQVASFIEKFCKRGNPKKWTTNATFMDLETGLIGSYVKGDEPQVTQLQRVSLHSFRNIFS